MLDLLAIPAMIFVQPDVIWDDEADRVTFRRLPFDFKGYIQAMIGQNVDLPGWLLELLVAIAK